MDLADAFNRQALVESLKNDMFHGETIMLMSRCLRVVSGFLSLVIAAWGVQVLASESDPNASPSVAEIIEALDPPPKLNNCPDPAIKCRGVGIGARAIYSMELQFEFNSDVILPGEEGKLNTMANALKSERLASKSLKIEGHTDAKGSDEYNILLSARRAAAVVKFLRQQGIEPTRLISTGVGKKDLKNTKDPYAAENRRVIFSVIK